MPTLRAEMPHPQPEHYVLMQWKRPQVLTSRDEGMEADNGIRDVIYA